MAATPSTSTCNRLLNCPRLNGHSSISPRFINFRSHYSPRGLRNGHSSSIAVKAVEGEHRRFNTTSWDEKPFEILPNGEKAYLDEQDVVTFLDPPKELIPLDPSTYNPAAYLWKKIADIPEERRHRLLHLLKPKLISTVWGVAGVRYDDPKLAKRSSSSLLSSGDMASAIEFWNCRKSGGPMRIAWADFFKAALFCKDGQIYGRFAIGSLLGRIANSWSPLYFTICQRQEVMPTEQPCDLAYEFGDGLLDLHDYPQGFPKPAKHPWPFEDQVVVYVRHVGPGVMIGQAWQEGKALEQVPKKLCGEILMVKDYAVVEDDR